MRLRPWSGCSLPGAQDFVELGDIDLNAMDAHSLHALARYIGIVPISVDKKPLTAEVLKRELEEHAISA